MKHILTAASREILDRFAWSDVLLAFDFDGTLAPIVRQPETATMRPGTRRRLVTLAERYPCVVISGRSRADLTPRLEGIELRRIVGNHGVEPWQGTPVVSRVVERWRAQLIAAVGALRGVDIEDKRYSLAVHYRASRQKKLAREAIRRAVAQLAGARVIGGKLVVNVVPRAAPHKGIALERLRDALGCDTAIYVGDDETDEDVFGLPGRERLLAIRVGAKRGSRADYFIRDQRELDRLLDALLAQRGARAASRRTR